MENSGHTQTEKSEPNDTEDRADGDSIKYNTVFERILARSQGQEGESDVVAYVAYALYKIEKRDWLIQRQRQTEQPVTAGDVEAYTSGWTELRINSVIVQARAIIDNFANDVLQSSKEDINDQVYKGQFQKLHDVISGHSRVAETEANKIMTRVDLRTRSSWGVSITQNLLANLAWTVIVIIILVSLNINFDFNNFGNRMRAFLQAPSETTQPR